MDIKDLLSQIYIRLRADSEDKADMLTAATKSDESNNTDLLKWSQIVTKLYLTKSKSMEM